MLSKFSSTTFLRTFKTLSALGACHVTIIGGVEYEKSMIFVVLGAYFIEFLILLHKIFFGSKILPSSCDVCQKFGYECFTALETRLKVPILAISCRLLAFFELSILAQAFSLGH